MKKKREHWGSSFGFIMAAAGSAIGLGTLWQFPFLTVQNGGGLFVLLFLFFTLVLGFPIFIGEIIMGRKVQKGVVGIYSSLSKDSPKWRVLGWVTVSVPFLILSYYGVIAGWGLNYILLSLTQFYKGKSPQEIADVYNVMFVSPQINLFWQSIFMFITASVVYQGIRKGIEYWSKILMSALLILLAVLLLYSMSLSGFSEAMRYVFYPDISKLRPSGILEALGLAFYTLSLGQGIMLTYGSYMSTGEDIPKTAAIVSVMNLVVSVFAAMMIFPIIFTFGIKPDVGGFGLVFQTLPVLFKQLPGSLVLSTSFFILLVFTALTSAVSLLEVVVANFIDLKGVDRKKAVIYVSIAAFIVGIPSALSGGDAMLSSWKLMYGKNFFNTLVDLISQWLIPLCGLGVAVFIGFSMDKQQVKNEFISGTVCPKMFSIWYFFVKWIAPIAIMLIILQRSGLVNLDLLF